MHNMEAHNSVIHKFRGIRITHVFKIEVKIW